MRPRTWIPALLALALLPAAACAADDYLADGRTAAAVSFASPRAPLRECLRVLSEASGVTLTAGPALAEEAVVGYVPRRSLRETMQALEELFDGAWTQLPGPPPTYRLDLAPDAAKRQAAARASLKKQLLARLNEAAAQEAERRKNPSPSRTARPQALAALIWGRTPPALRERVLAGGSATITVPEAQAKELYDLLTRRSLSSGQRPSGPLVATLELDDLADTGVPMLRVRALAVGPAVAVSGQGSLELAPPAKEPEMPPDASDGGVVLPPDIGDSGRLVGERDEVLLRLALGAQAPILSRHRPWGGGSGIQAGGRPVTSVVGELARLCGASHKTNARGYHLLRSGTEHLDALGQTPAALLQPYLKARPAAGKIASFRQVAELAALTPLQLSLLSRSNRVREDTRCALEAYSLVSFYRALTPAEREALYSETGVELAGLTAAQLHALLSDPARAGVELPSPVENWRKLRVRLVEPPEGRERALAVQLWRDGRLANVAQVELPRVAADEAPVAQK